MTRTFRLLVVCCGVLALCSLGACKSLQPSQNIVSVPFRRMVLVDDFEITFSVNGSVYMRELGEKLACDLEIKYIGNEEDIVIYHGGMPFLLDLAPKPDTWPDSAITSIGAHTLLKQGEAITFIDQFPWSEKKLAAGEYMLKVWVVFSLSPDAETQWGDPVFEVPIIVY